MKKTFLILLATIVATAFLATDCNTTTETPRSELLIQKKGWELSTATSIPAFTNIDGVTNENLFVSFFYDCEKDDILYFYENKSSILNYGKEICEGDEGKDISLGNWQLVKDEEVLEFHLPYFFDPEGHFALLEAKIVVLDENTMTLRIPLEYDNDEEEPAKAGKIRNDRGMKGAKSVTNYEFTFTYKIAK